MIFPFIRHEHRYEFIANMGYVTGKHVLDVGCGNGIGAYLLATKAKAVVGVDPCLKDLLLREFVYLQPKGDNLQLVGEDIFNPCFEGRVDVVTAIEVFEHMPDPLKFISRLAELGNELFITTPCVDVTHKSRNPDHVMEYSSKDFKEIVGTKFDVLQEFYQNAELCVVDTLPEKLPLDSYDFRHVVQMLWCRRKVSV